MDNAIIVAGENGQLTARVEGQFFYLGPCAVCVNNTIRVNDSQNMQCRCGARWRGEQRPGAFIAVCVDSGR